MHILAPYTASNFCQVTQLPLRREVRGFDLPGWLLKIEQRKDYIIIFIQTKVSRIHKHNGRVCSISLWFRNLYLTMESLLKNLKKQVTCSICFDTYTKPKTITCLHTFYCECLTKHALTSQRQGKYRCPDCQEEVDIPESNRFDNLPTSFLYISLLSLLAVQQSEDGSEISCGVCKKKSAEISYCFDCEKLLCPDCVIAHKVFQAAAMAFEGHKITPVKEFQAQDYEVFLKRQSLCSQQYHEREVMRFFCLDCQTCVSQICINMDHEDHNVDQLEIKQQIERKPTSWRASS